MNPNVILNMILNNSQFKTNPVISNAINMYQKGDNAGLKALCENVCKERGIDINQYANSIMQQFK